MKKFLDQVRTFSLQKFFSKFELWIVRTCISSNLRKKNPGVVILIPTIILSGLILVVSVGLSQVLITELEFSADLLFSEKAYFAAESGVEKSLLALKEKPLNLVIEDGVAVGTGATYDLNIANSVEQFPFSLAKDETMKFRLGVDTSDNFAEYSLKPVTTFKINKSSEPNAVAFSNADLQWEIICPKKGEGRTIKTVSLQGRGDDFSKGIYDDGLHPLITNIDGEIVGPEENLAKFLGENNLGEDICFMSLTNTESIDITGNFSVYKKIAPAKVKITASGKSFSREKIVNFEYRQKNLSSLLDLGLYLTEE